MTSSWQPHREPLLTTLLRTVTIAAVLGLLLSLRFGGLSHWPATTLLMLWPSLGGHFVEIAFLNYLRPRLPIARPVQISTRLATWFLGGVALFLAMRLTATSLSSRPLRWPSWWIGGVAFIAIELLVHLILQLRHKPNFYNGRG